MLLQQNINYTEYIWNPHKINFINPLLCQVFADRVTIYIKAKTGFLQTQSP